MNAWMLVAVFLAAVVAAVLYGRAQPDERTLTEAMADFDAAFEDLRAALGEELIPAIRMATDAMQRLAEAFRR